MGLSNHYPINISIFKYILLNVFYCCLFDACLLPLVTFSLFWGAKPCFTVQPYIGDFISFFSENPYPAYHCMLSIFCDFFHALFHSWLMGYRKYYFSSSNNSYVINYTMVWSTCLTSNGSFNNPIIVHPMVYLVSSAFLYFLCSEKYILTFYQS